MILHNFLSPLDQLSNRKFGVLEIEIDTVQGVRYDNWIIKSAGVQNGVIKYA